MCDPPIASLLRKPFSISLSAKDLLEIRVVQLFIHFCPKLVLGQGTSASIVLAGDLLLELLNSALSCMCHDQSCSKSSSDNVRIQPLPTTCTPVAWSATISVLGYSSSRFAGLPVWLSWSTLHTAARVVLRDCNSEHVSPLLRTCGGSPFHSLPRLMRIP